MNKIKEKKWKKNKVLQTNCLQIHLKYNKDKKIYKYRNK